MRPWRVKDANSKPIEVVTFGDVDAEKRVDDNLVEILKMKGAQDPGLRISTVVQFRKL